MIAVSEKKNVPDLRFSSYKQPWSRNKLDELFDISAGGDIDASHVSRKRNNKFPFPIYANDQKDKGFYGYSDVYIFEGGVITVAGRGVNIGIAHVRHHNFYPIVRLLVLSPKINIDIKFFEYEINRINFFLESTGVPQLTSPQISNYKVGNPKLGEQKKSRPFWVR